MARVNLERAVFSDPRIKILASLIGVTKWDAIGRLAAVWEHCTETSSYVLSEAILNALHDDVPAFAEALVKAKLGRKHRHGIYICGTRGRIEWLEKKRQAARENGKKSKGRPKTNAEPIENLHRLQAETTTTTAPAIAPAITPAAVPSEPQKKNKKESASDRRSEKKPPRALAHELSLNFDEEERAFEDHHEGASTEWRSASQRDAKFCNWLRKSARDRAKAKASNTGRGVQLGTRQVPRAIPSYAGYDGSDSRRTARDWGQKTGEELLRELAAERSQPFTVQQEKHS